MLIDEAAAGVRSAIIVLYLQETVVTLREDPMRVTDLITLYDYNYWANYHIFRTVAWTAATDPSGIRAAVRGA